MSVSAVVICREPHQHKLPRGVDEQVTHSGCVIESAKDAQKAWFSAVDKVRTEWFFYWDTDDELPRAFPEVLDQCVRAGADLAYTDERIVLSDTQSFIRKAGPYKRDAHVLNPMLLHHLVVVRTDAARQAIARLPVGHYWPEMLLFAEIARAGAAYVPRVGYIWNRNPEGLNRKWFTGLAMMESQLWCKENP